MASQTSSSKVAVEYFDPSGLFQLLLPGLLPRLPLRNLHWESHSGPLRSISSLHIDFVPNENTSNTLSSAEPFPSSTSNPTLVRCEDSEVTGDDGFRLQVLGGSLDRPTSPKPVLKEPRHQIPGLRQTPYLKVLLVRCDDNDTYKGHVRQQVREWIKVHTPSHQSTKKANSQENHDAFEWLIIHVIVPNTAAASQPRLSGRIAEGSSGSVSDKTPAARWRGGGSSTIFEKLRADFNASSKSAVDHVAQIRIGINDVPYEMLPRVVPAIPGSYTESPQESENAYLDLISKLKLLILTSFDMRVSQYEEDIREKDRQRMLPGWNFCTFFVLKEGLARGFESVGLVEDALAGYDELAVGLDSIVREQAGVTHGGTFLPYTEELKREAEHVNTAIMKDLGEDVVVESEETIDLQSSSDPIDQVVCEIPLDVSKKPYRELILSNDISVFDFRCYLFARQLSLLLRLANASSSQEDLLAKLKEQRESSLQGVTARLPVSQPVEDLEDLTILSEICIRSMKFLSTVTGIMRDDIWASRQQSQLAADVQEGAIRQVLDNMVSSFTFSVAQQILAQTSTKSLPIPPSTLAPATTTEALKGVEPKAAIPEPKTMMHPARSSSLALRSNSGERPTLMAFPGGRRSNVPEQSTTSPAFLKRGLEELAAHRGELYLLSRNVLEQLAPQRGWNAGRLEMLTSHDSLDLDDVDLTTEIPDRDRQPVGSPNIPPLSLGITSKLIKRALDREDNFYRLYETLTDKALRHFSIANHSFSVQMSIVDLAVLKYNFNDYATAAKYFYRITTFCSEGGWLETEHSILVLYARCLKKLQREEEYVRVVLRLLLKAAMIGKESLECRYTSPLGRNSSVSEVISSELYLRELLQITGSWSQKVHVPLTTFLGHVEIEGPPRYPPEQDSFVLEFRLQYLLRDELVIEKARVKIDPISSEPCRELWLEAEGQITLKEGNTRLQVQSNIMIPGIYIVSQIILYTGGLALQYTHDSTSTSFNRGAFFKGSKFQVYQRAEAFDARLFASKYLHLDRNRSLEIELSSGWNDVLRGELHVRAATAGLRLQISETKLANGSLEISHGSDIGIIQFGSMRPGSKATLRMPFNLEHEVNDVSLKLEIYYTTEKGNFVFVTAPKMSIILPLGVNVQDFFKHKDMFSRFTISTATSKPLRLLNSHLEPSDIFEAHRGVYPSTPVVVFHRQPSSMLFRITRSPEYQSMSRRPRKDIKISLSLVLHYVCIEEEIDTAVTQAVIAALRDTTFRDYKRLAVPAVIAELRKRLSMYDIEQIAVVGELSTSIISNVKWDDYFAGLGRSVEEDQDIAELLAQKLQDWQQRTPNIRLNPTTFDSSYKDSSRSIIISVDVPSVTIVHTADLRLAMGKQPQASLSLATLNEPISASLHITWTRLWDQDWQSESGDRPQLEDLHFVYEVTGAPDTWLVGGRRKGHFRILTAVQASKRDLVFPVVLVPLREGCLPYPSVEIKSVTVAKAISPSRVGQNDGPEVKQRPVTCETDYRNAVETIRVISDAWKTTLSLDAGGPQGGGAWLLESQRRVGVEI